MPEERLQKILSRAGVASRRAAERLIAEGRVEVNGRVVRELGSKAHPEEDQIRVDGKLIAVEEEKVYVILNKPEKIVTTLSDPEGRRCVGDLVKPIKVRVFPVGRLDYDAEGALLLTNDGDLAHTLAHPRWGVRRVYLAKVKGTPNEATLQRMRDGVRLEDGMARAVEVSMERRTAKNTWIRLVLTEGRHHLVKRLCEAVGHPVARLVRDSYAGVGIDGMAPGELRFLTAKEVRQLKSAVKTEAPLPKGGIPKRRQRQGVGAVRDPIMGTTRPGPGPRGPHQGSRQGPSQGPKRGAPRGKPRGRGV